MHCCICRYRVSVTKVPEMLSFIENLMMSKSSVWSYGSSCHVFKKDLLTEHIQQRKRKKKRHTCLLFDSMIIIKPIESNKATFFFLFLCQRFIFRSSMFFILAFCVILQLYFFLNFLVSFSFLILIFKWLQFTDIKH